MPPWPRSTPSRTGPRNWDTAAGIAAGLLPALVAAPPRTVLNLNVPDAPAERVPGLRPSTLADFGQVQVAIAESGDGFVRTSIREREAELDPGTDLANLAEGYAAITALRGVHHAADVVLDLPVCPT